MASFFRKNWLRTLIITGIFIAAGSAPFIIEQQMLPMVQLSSLLTNFYNPLTGEMSLEDLIDSIMGINVLASTETQTTLLITIQMYNPPWSFYPMKIPSLNLDLYFKAGRPYDSEKQILQQFKADPGFHGVIEPLYDPLSFSWVRTMNILIPQEINIPVGMPAPVNLIVTLYSNGQEENALSQMLGTIIRNEKIPAQRLYAKGEVIFMGVPIPISLDVPEFELPTATEEGGDLTDLLSTFFIDMKPETEALDLFHLADLRNYNDQNNNFYRDWNDTLNPNGLKDENENFTEPILENGTLSVSPFLRLTSKLSIGGGSASLSKSPWNIQEEQDPSGVPKYGNLSYWNTKNILGFTKYTPKQEIEDSIWGTADQQILLYCPSSLANQFNKPNWANRIIGTVGFINDQRMSLDGHGSSVPLLLSADVKITGDARPNSNFTAGEAINVFLPQILEHGNVSIGVLGNIKLKIGKMPLSLVIKTEIEQDIGGLLGESSSNSQTQGLGALQNNNGGTGASDLISYILNFFDFKNFIFNGLAMDVYHKILQANSTIDLDLFFPYGIYLPETEEEISDFLDLEGGPIQLFNASKPSNWDTLNLTFPYNIPDTVITENFESYVNDTAWHASPTWSIYDPTTSSNVTLVTDGGKSGTKGIVYTTDNTLNASIRRDFTPQDGISGFYFDIMLNNTDGNFYVALQNKTMQLLQLQFENTTGGNNLNFGGNSAYLNNENWYRVYVAVDRTTGTYDVSVEGIVNETFTPTGGQTQYPLRNTPSSSDFIQVVAFNESDMMDTVFGNGATGTFQTSRRIRQLYFVENTEYFTCDGSTYEFQITNEANTTGALAGVIAFNGFNLITFNYSSVGSGYEYTYESGSRTVRTFFNGLSLNLTSDYIVYIGYFVEEDRIIAPIDGTSVSITDANPSANTTILIYYHARDRDVFQYATSPSST
ncbi:MAG: hypothetical protein ACFFDN_23455, partial [Candidatus Hodarchaeota archaeon]